MNLRSQFVQLRRVSRVNDNLPLTKKLPKYKNHWKKNLKFLGPVTEHLQRSPIEVEVANRGGAAPPPKLALYTGYFRLKIQVFYLSGGCVAVCNSSLA